jgi:hypothetical protein
MPLISAGLTGSGAATVPAGFGAAGGPAAEGLAAGTASPDRRGSSRAELSPLGGDAAGCACASRGADSKKHAANAALLVAQTRIFSDLVASGARDARTPARS